MKSCHYADIPVNENVENQNYIFETASGKVLSSFYRKEFDFSFLVNDVGFTIFNNNIQKAVGEKNVEILAVIMKDSIKSSNKANNAKFFKSLSLLQPLH